MPHRQIADRLCGHLAPLGRLPQGLGERIERFAPLACRGGHHFANHVAAHDRSGLTGHRHEPCGIVNLRRKHAGHRPLLSQPANEGPRVDSLDADHARGGEILSKRAGGGEVARRAARRADDETGHLEATTFHIRLVDTVVADLRRGHRENLAAVARVGENLLVAGHRGVETDLSGDGTDRTEGLADVDRAILECECRRRHAACLLVYRIRDLVGPPAAPTSPGNRHHPSRRPGSQKPPVADRLTDRCRSGERPCRRTVRRAGRGLQQRGSRCPVCSAWCASLAPRRRVAARR